MHSMRLPTTQIVVTSAIEFSMKNVDYFDQFVSTALNRFFNGDWGEMDSENDRKMNDYETLWQDADRFLGDQYSAEQNKKDWLR